MDLSLSKYSLTSLVKMYKDSSTLPQTALKSDLALQQQQLGFTTTSNTKPADHAETIKDAN